jgi:hypothetical protein
MMQIKESFNHPESLGTSALLSRPAVKVNALPAGLVLEAEAF